MGGQTSGAKDDRMKMPANILFSICVFALLQVEIPSHAQETAPPGLSRTDLSQDAVAAADPYLWLEEVDGQRALEWVAGQNIRTDAVLRADGRYLRFRDEAMAILTAADRLPAPRYRGQAIDTFWQDATHLRGVWRTAEADAFLGDAPQWTVLLDIDDLARREDANWVFKGADCLPSDPARCLVSLSDGGKDAVVVREFDTRSRRFVPGGFTLPEGKHRLAWMDRDTLLVASDFGEGSLTESGYPFTVRALRRGEALLEATEVFRGDRSDGGYGVRPSVHYDDQGKAILILVDRPIDTFRSETWEIHEGKAARLALPERVEIHGVMGGDDPRLVMTINEAMPFVGSVASKGSLIALGLTAVRSSTVADVADPVVLAPGRRQSVADVAVFDEAVVVSLYDNVRASAYVYRSDPEGAWRRSRLPVPENVSVALGASSRREGKVFLTYEGFLIPPTLASVDTDRNTMTTVMASPPRFSIEGRRVDQFEAVSHDGEKIPYFIVRPEGSPGPGGYPTLMFGYGGFQLSYPPAYRPELGKIWLERGGAYVVANIRGGGEFGPDWHQAALKERRQTAFDDFAAVASDLHQRGLTSAGRLAVYGRSNGGVLTSVTLTQHPELIGGAVVESPLVDMLRYHLLPPGASWIGEYGDPRDPAQAAFIARYSAYQNIDPEANYPEVYITTNMRDDRVHPGHARKFAARLQALGHRALYYETANGGHSNDSDPALNAERWARHYVYLARALGLAED
jgi:prolyl oligopeptidase